MFSFIMDFIGTLASVIDRIPILFLSCEYQTGQQSRGRLRLSLMIVTML